MIGILRRRWWIILLPVVIGTILGTVRAPWSLDEKPAGRDAAIARESRQTAEQSGPAAGASPADKSRDVKERFGLTFAWSVGGLALGLALAALAEYRGASFKTEADVKRLLALPVLAAIPLMTSDPRARSGRRRKWTFGARIWMLFALAGSAAALILWSLQS